MRCCQQTSLRTFTAQKKKTPNFKRKPSISTAWRQHLGLIVLSSTHDWRHASVVISEDQSIVTSFKAQLGFFCIDVGSNSACIHVGSSFLLYTCGICFSPYKGGIDLSVYMSDRPSCTDERSFFLYKCGFWLFGNLYRLWMWITDTSVLLQGAL